jgi:glycosyltransferase involved in cell wall biosynthesis
MIVIATNNGINYLPKLLISLEATNSRNIPICIVDTGSTNEEFISYLKNLEETNKYTILWNSGGYDTGAWIYTYENIKADFYIFLQDSTEVLDGIFFESILNELKDDTMFGFFTFLNGEGGSFEEELSPYFDKKDIQNYPMGIFGPMFACNYQTMKKLYDSKLYIIPKNKMDAMTMERGWGVIAHILKLKLIYFDSFWKLHTDSIPYFRKHLVYHNQGYAPETKR